ncbi:FAD-binding oxidoreductase [Olivibacter sp. SDN3]|uniref:NAD(P)/FAD-dependent oxidoreductase n=1 Tax=Olivibacter sp. SDN3 TaxID=2764720 RepID=UPI001650EFE4|nr:FAD-binding oxidoreductase [Olivibacter sp. SDN3]QNL50744.1 FAD-binding oxidoreductase [Olivibacter sp. SDN3]
MSGINFNKKNKGNIVVIGGGIAGLCSAYYLLKSGWKVTLLDAGDITDNCSYGNAGMIVPSHFTPLAAPGIVAQGMKWLFNSKSPFYVKPSISMQLFSWGLKFIRHARASHVERSAPAIRDLNLLSSTLYDALAAEPGFDFEWQHKGILMLYKKEQTAEEEMHLAAQAQELGLDAMVLGRQEVQALEPQMKLNVLGGVHYRCDSHLYPQALMGQLIQYVKQQGAVVQPHTAVTGFEIKRGEIKAVLAGHQRFEAHKVVMTGGAWLPELAKKAGLTISLMPGKGYSFMYEPHKQRLQHPALLLEARVAVTPMNGQIRFGGTMELAAVNDRINLNRVQGIVDAIPQYYPNLQVEMPERKNVWFGFRPCSPDGLPYLGNSKKIKNLLIAGGCGMMGLSLGPAVGKIVSELAEEVTPSANIRLFSPDRF